MDRDLQALQDVRTLLERARDAQKRLATMSQGEIDRIVEAMVRAGSRESKRLAEVAVEESGFGVVESKVVKNKFATDYTWGFIKDLKTCGIIHKDEETRVYEVAEPVGVVAALIPITNPTSTALHKCIISIKARNPVIVSPHPRGTRCIGETCKVVYEAALRAGAPDGCIGCMQIITMAAAEELMRKADLILATGGIELVKAAYSMGTPALGVGPGNPPAYIHPSADLHHAVSAVVLSQTFDNATICSSEQSVVTHLEIKEAVLNEFVAQGAHICSKEEIAKLEKIVLRGKRQNPDIVGQYPRVIARMAGFTVPHDTTVMIANQSGKGVGFDFPLSIEKLAPILSFYAEPDVDACLDRCRRLLEFGGDGHTMGIHCQREDIIERAANLLPASRVLVNSPTSQGSIGYSTNLIPSMSLGCGTPGKNITTDNISPLNLVNVKRIAFCKPGFVEGGGLGPQFGIDPGRGLGFRQPVGHQPVTAKPPQERRHGPMSTPFTETSPLSPGEIESILARALDRG